MISIESEFPPAPSMVEALRVSEAARSLAGISSGLPLPVQYDMSMPHPRRRIRALQLNAIPEDGEIYTESKSYFNNPEDENLRVPSPRLSSPELTAMRIVYKKGKAQNISTLSEVLQKTCNSGLKEEGAEHLPSIREEY